MVVTSRCFTFRALITQARIWKRFWQVYFIYPFPRRLKHAVSIFFAWPDILSKKNPYFGKHLFCKTKTDYACNLRVQDFATGKTREFCFFSRESYYKSNRKLSFPVFAYPDVNTRGVGRILDSYANPRRSRRFASDCLEFSRPLSRLYQAMQTWKTFSIS